MDYIPQKSYVDYLNSPIHLTGVVLLCQPITDLPGLQREGWSLVLQSCPSEFQFFSTNIRHTGQRQVFL